MDITSTAIDARGQILPEYTADGTNVNPPVTFSQIPAGTQSLVFVIEDYDAPQGHFVHWLLYNMLPSTLQIVENSVPPGAVVGTNDFGQTGYGGPKPPSGTHHYCFRLIALDDMLNLGAGANWPTLEAAIQNHIIAFKELEGTYTAKS